LASCPVVTASIDDAAAEPAANRLATVNNRVRIGILLDNP
jgi:hypothetical protein